jgi:hypothetical protein
MQIEVKYDTKGTRRLALQTGTALLLFTGIVSLLRAHQDFGGALTTLGAGVGLIFLTIAAFEVVLWSRAKERWFLSETGLILTDPSGAEMAIHWTEIERISRIWRAVIICLKNEKVRMNIFPIDDQQANQILASWQRHMQK